MQLRTTIRLEESLLEQAKAEAARQNKTLTSLVEEGLHLVLKEAQKPVRRKKIVVPVSKRTGGTWPGIDINNSAELLDIMDGYLDPSRR
jgi:uncharacterized protein DUF6364